MSVPDRGSIIRVHSMKPSLNLLLILSSRAFTKKSGVLIGCSVVDESRGALTNVCLYEGAKFAVPELIFTLPLKTCRFEQIAQVPIDIVDQVVLKLIPLVGGGKFLTG